MNNKRDRQTDRQTGRERERERQLERERERQRERERKRTFIDCDKRSIQKICFIDFSLWGDNWNCLSKAIPVSAHKIHFGAK